MKKIGSIAFIGLAYAMASMQNEGFQIVERGSVSKGGLEPEERVEIKMPTFKDQDGVLKTINEYKLIQSGKSKQGPIKQARTIAKIKTWIDKDFLTKEDLK